MKVLVISSQHPFKVSGIAAWDFYQNLLRHGDASRFLTLYSLPSRDVSFLAYFNSRWSFLLFLIKRKIFRKKAKQADPEYYYNGETLIPPFVHARKIMQKLDGFAPDVIVLFFEKGFINAQTLCELHQLTGAPVYWYLMDMQPMTGGCAYARACTGYQRQCGNCPAIFSNRPDDLTAANLQNALTYYDRTDLTVIAASEPLRRQAASSTLFRHKRIVKIPLGINEQWFKPLNADERKAVRHKYHLPVSGKILFFGAVSTLEKRKGTALLLEAFQLLVGKHATRLDFRDVAVVVAGSSSDRLKTQLESLADVTFPVHALGFLETHAALGEILGASDVFISPSIEDAGPMMVNQAVMCGTPVVAFPIGVARDLVISGISGYRTDTVSSEALAEAIAALLSLSSEQLAALRIKTAEVGQTHCSLSENYRAFRALFHPDPALTS